MTSRTTGERTRGERPRQRPSSRHRAPDALLRFDPNALGLVEPPRSFYRRNTVSVAQDLLGSWIARRYRGAWYGGRIVETEAYLGIEDAAAHSWRGRRTRRVEPMYADGGHLYVFFVYGMHDCVNVVTRKEGIGQAVLLRAAAGPAAAPTRRMSGPGKLAAALGITVADSGQDLVGGGPIRIFRRPRARRPRIAASPRIGVDYSGAAAAWPLRFLDPDSPAVSGRIRDRKVSTVSRE